MKLTIQRDVLITGLSRVIDCAQTKVTMPILCSVYLEAGKDLTITATNLDISATTSVPAAVKEPGKIAVNAKRVLEIARSASSDDISIEANDKLRVSIKSGGASFSFAGMDASEFPIMQPAPTTGTVECAADALANMLNSVVCCQSTDPSRYILMGVHAVLRDGELVAEATSGVRLARNVKKVDSTSSFDVIIPSHSVSILSKLLKESSSVSLSVGERHATTRLVHTEGNGETVVVSKVLEGKYPNTAQVIPSKVNGTMKVAREQLAELVGRVSIVCTELVPYVRLSITEKELAVSAASPEKGEASESMPIEYDGAPLEIGVNSRMLSDALAHTGGETISVGLSTPSSPIVFRNEDPGYIHIVMPSKIA
jgi:DNA polymerase-3 subunit beta